MKNCFELLARKFVVAALPLTMVVSCSDYEGMIDEDYEDWIAEQDSSSSASDSSSSEEESSSGKDESTSSRDDSSSSAAENSSSSALVVSKSSSSQSSSSSIQQSVMLNIGTCAPVKNPISKGETTSWKFAFNKDYSAGLSALDIVGMSYVWNFGAAASPSTESARGKSTSSEVVYSNSGEASASVDIVMNGQNIRVQCTDLQVNGDPITGCMCSASATSVDISTIPDVTWTVSGCTSYDHELNYEWDGFVGDASFTRTFAEAGAIYAPVLRVHNDDETVVDVACPAVKTTLGPEYLLEKSTDEVQLPAGASTVCIGGKDSFDTCIFGCSARGELSIELSTGEKMTGAYYVSDVVSPEACSGTIEVVLSNEAVCSARWF